MSTPFPAIFQADQTWGGNDGNWSLFNITVGTPPRVFSVLPGNRPGNVWVPVPEGCAGLASKTFNCAASRGVGFANGQQPLGFESNASTTWDPLGLYYLSAEQNLFGNDDAGVYGFDTVTLDASPSLELHNQTVAGIATWDFWIGILGLGATPSHFAILADSAPTVVESLKANNDTPSLAYGLYAGASYRQDPGAIVFGGYDAARKATAGISIPSQAENNLTDLVVSLRGVQLSNSLLGTIAFPDETKNLSLVLDSSTAQLWLPTSLCDQLAAALGLQYQNGTGFYLLNSTMHSQLQAMNPQFVFTLAADASTGTTTAVTLPYAAFDQQLGLPYYNTTTPLYYFPIRRAANESQYTLGRAFLQEAYLIVDHERQNFTIGQAAHGGKSVASNIVPILSPVAAQSPAGGLSKGAIAGIVIGVLALVAGLTALALLFWRRRRQRRQKQLQEQAQLLAESQEKAGEKAAAEAQAASEDFHKDKNDSTAELGGKPIIGEELMSVQMHELMGFEVHELHHDDRKTELESPGIHGLMDHKSIARRSELGGGREQEVHELPGSCVVVKAPGSRDGATDSPRPP